MICKICGTQNDEHARFCLKCGDNLKKQKKEQYRPSHRGPNKGTISNLIEMHSRKLLLTISVVLIVVSITMWLDRQQKSEAPQQATEERSSNPAIEFKVKDIASQFVCMCGSCSEESLDVCTCNKAVQERQMIRDYLTEGQSAEQIMKVLDANYGGRKTKLLEERRQDKEAYEKLNLNPLKRDSEVRNTASTRIATIADVNAIVEQFQCNCGRCEVDDLKDCSCSHPKGASEVKAFINNKIGEGKYTVGQVVNIVDQTYGGRKTQNAIY